MRSKNAPGDAAITIRRTRALQLREGGATYQQIADALRTDPDVVTPPKYSESHAWRDIDAEMGRLRGACTEQTQRVLELELRRLDALHAAHWHLAVSGDVPATKAVLAVMDRRAKLLGLDQPQRHEMVLTPDLVAREIERLEVALAINDGDGS